MKDPYLYEKSTGLKNLANITDQKELDDYETTMVNLGIINLLKSHKLLYRVEDIFVIHKALFLNVYEWAGEPRISISQSQF